MTADVRINEDVVLPRADHTELCAAVDGPVLEPGDLAYEEECRLFNLRRALTPAVAVGATSTDDVATAVRYANRHGMAVAVRGQGHQVVLPRHTGTLLISTRRLREVTVDAGRRTVLVGAGTTWSEVLAETDRFGLAPVVGSAPHVSVVGYTLGGGLSPLLGRSLGYAADHVRRMEVVTADGTVRHVTHDSDPDLYWALLGGKGNFGVVTRMEFDVFPVRRFYGGGLWFSGEHIHPVLRAWRALVPALGEETTTSFSVQRLPDVAALPEPVRGAFVVHIRLGHLGPAREGARLLQPLRAVAPPVHDTLAERPFREIGEIHLDPVHAMPFVETSFGLREFSDVTLERFVELTGPGSGCSMKSVEVRALGGALDRNPARPNSVPSRGTPFMTFAVGGGPPTRIGAMQDFLRAYTRGLAPWSAPHNLINFVSPDEALSEAAVRDLYGGQRYARLAALKRVYDPANVFNVNHNIRPAR
ncbi:FAD-binding oxidoreductase [Streptomyces sp. S.PB5]|uniref:FAD-binding oxidoreductase n=1 Tax=Streptomyces sp. S.PB5 TaxID=3020844 RepID=UPI0025B14023|nr:FAD-binding oxidoreductase [Streptomyces sp. S.PB5]MDN3029668.1 FAD-binding oxidoreductase [Streptomyces sp. S.PB5]